MQNDKPLSTDGLTKNFYETCWNELQEIFVENVSEAKEKGNLKRKKIDFWRPISLLDVELKIISKDLSKKLKKF